MRAELDPRDFEGIPGSPFAAPTAGTSTPVDPPGTRAPRPSAPRPPDRRPTWQWVVAGVVGLAVAGAALLLVLRGGGDPSTPEPDPSPEAAAGTGDVDPDGSGAGQSLPATPPGSTGQGASTTTPPIGAAPDALAQAPAAAVGVATRFAHGYLSYDEADPDRRAADLAPFLSPDLDPQLGWSGSGRQAAGLAFPVDVRQQADGPLVVTTTVSVTGDGGPRWVHLAVPLATDADGRWVVIGQPAFVPPPTPGTPDLPATPAEDPDATAQARPTIEAFLVEWAVADTVALDGVTPPGVAVPGLGDRAGLQEVVSVAVLEGPEEARTALVSVRWANRLTGGEFTQAYRVSVVGDGAGGWLVTGIAGG